MYCILICLNFLTSNNIILTSWWWRISLEQDGLFLNKYALKLFASSRRTFTGSLTHLLYHINSGYCLHSGLSEFSLSMFIWLFMLALRRAWKLEIILYHNYAIYWNMWNMSFIAMWNTSLFCPMWCSIIDSGMYRTKEFNPRLQISSLAKSHKNVLRLEDPNILIWVTKFWNNSLKKWNKYVILYIG